MSELRQLRIRELRGEKLLATERLRLERVRKLYRKDGTLLVLQAKEDPATCARPKKGPAKRGRMGKLIIFPSGVAEVERAEPQARSLT